MNPLLRFLFAAVVFLPVLPLPAQPAGDLLAVTRILEGARTRQISSHQPNGGNDDRIKGIAPGQKRTIMDVAGAGIITRIWFTLAPEPDRLARNDIILRMYWDGHDQASVASPIGPFFGQGWNEAYNFVSAPLAAAPKDGRSLVSYFAMPFARGARVEIENQSDETIGALYFNIDYDEMKELPPATGRFHAWFNREITDAGPDGENEWRSLGNTVGVNPEGKENYLVADIRGRGHFVGVNYYVQSPSPMWYGEGDEMVFIDGESRPSINGTGTEDYFNTAWCPKELYSHPYFGLARVNEYVGWMGRHHLYRFHLADPIRFDQSLRFTFEHGHGNVLTLDLATVAYWYLSEATGVPPIPDKQGRSLMPAIHSSDIHRWRDAWRRQMGNGSRLWGNEVANPQQP